MKSAILFLVLCGIFAASCKNAPSEKNLPEKIRMVPFESIHVNGELKERIWRNFDRLEEEKYHPENVFLTEKQSGSWPGDTEGRTILGIVMDARSSKRTPKYLKEIIDRIPSKLNERGYMGPVYEGKMNEQQLSGNGWMLRALCEYYDWTRDSVVLDYIKLISKNLFVAGKGYYSEYPIDSNTRDMNVGGESGTTQVRGTDKWILSSDIGCLFIGMDGAIHAYQYLKTPELKEVIDEMLLKLQEIDVLNIKAQTHAILTASRGLIRYYGITGDKKYMDWAEKMFNIYKEHGMTEAHGNYNWFDRFDTWTEPCAIVDSYMLAVQLWMGTENPIYKEDAELIYYNALAHAQRSNGGFGTDNCPGVASRDCSLRSRSYEAHWCCTMRGGEGLGSAARYSAFTKGDTLYLPFLRDCVLDVEMKENKSVKITEKTDYPFGTAVKLVVDDNMLGDFTLKLPCMSWMENVTFTYNNRKLDLLLDNGFWVLTSNFQSGDVIDMSFDLKCHKEVSINKANSNDGQYKMYCGPLLLGVEANLDKDAEKKYGTMVFAGPDSQLITPVYHLMDEKIQDVAKGESLYSKLILFKD